MCDRPLPRVVDYIRTANFGDAVSATDWVTIPKAFSFLAIGPGSDVDAVIATNTPIGDVVVSVNSPLVLPCGPGVRIRPFYEVGTTQWAGSQEGVPVVPAHGGLKARQTLEVVTYDAPPQFWPNKRPPRRSAGIVNVNTTEVLLFHVPIMGAKSVRMSLAGGNPTTSLSWRLVALKADDGATQFPVSPTGYTETTPTYNVLPADSNLAYHLDVEVDAFEFLALYGKGTTTNWVGTVDWLVRD